MNNSRTVTLADAVKESRPTAFSTIVKPAGSACRQLRTKAFRS